MAWRSDRAWALVGLLAVALSGWLLYRELEGMSLDSLLGSLRAIPAGDWALCVAATLLAYAALAGYDRIALNHLGRRIGWGYISVVSFTTYAVGHNVGASVFSGALVRYRAYRHKGLTPVEIGLLVAFCSFTFVVGTLLLAAAVLLIEPELVQRFLPSVGVGLARGIGVLLLLAVGLYALGSLLKFSTLRLRGMELGYPRLPTVLQQLVIGPLEIIGAAAILYFALPEAGNPGYLVVLGVFLASFSLALVSHAPGGLGVLEVSVLLGLPEMDKADVLVAVLVFRLLYLLIPLALSMPVILWFERARWQDGLAGPPPP
ncbi:lysylphosphatidylglycerol synthase transmembrane domain-containing protein [Pseudomarimonas salicorniae]|uniref:Lysylphosphatidylglycerol synthase domain-containing protein n=1 Tax=Pseudomarimonas salicorniae TaxID=2933270 RepID=A0ABT0GE41_9GAMM|nr:YbhN family protein [Lysobacter sp. CAU 1642]MCK7592818.1 lysylphosphatidylglycerol synthase domain-containing protein [Lysobacter sp. CAU 1642]